MTESKELSFEDAMEKLEKIVERLEAGDVPLEKAIAYYQEGMELSKFCHNKLTDVKDKMTKILTEHNELEAFDIEEDS